MYGALQKWVFSRNLLFNVSDTIVRSQSHFFRMVGRILPWYIVKCLQMQYLEGHESASSQDRKYRNVLHHGCKFKSYWWFWKRDWVWECSWNLAEAVALVLRAEYTVPCCKASLSNRTKPRWFSSSSSRSKGKKVSRKTHVGLAKGNYYFVRSQHLG